jgi:hypothetical protein
MYGAAGQLLFISYFRDINRVIFQTGMIQFRVLEYTAIKYFLRTGNENITYIIQFRVLEYCTVSSENFMGMFNYRVYEKSVMIFLKATQRE